MTIYEKITNEIIEAIEDGLGTFQMPWNNQLGFPSNPISKTVYSGLNVLSLWCAGRHYSSNNWATYKQWQISDRQIEKGQKGTCIIFYERGESDDPDKPTFVIKSYIVFNEAQTKGYIQNDETQSFPPILNIEEAIHKTGVQIVRGGSEACYIPSLDVIRMPKPSLFYCGEARSSIENYYSVLLHELTHWSGHTSRLARNLSKRFGSHEYAMEELIAELGSAFMCAKLKLKSQPRLDHAPYIASWLKVLKSDPKAIFTASREAKVASEYLVGENN